jgi:uncharacterized protein
VEGAANEALVAFLAALLGVPRSRIHVVSGERSRRKRVRIDGTSADTVRRALGT